MDSKEVYQQLLAGSERLSSSWELEEGLSGLVHMAHAILEADAVAIALVKETQDYLRFVAATGLSETFMNRQKLPLGHTEVQRVLGGREDVSVEDGSRVNGPLKDLFLETHTGSLLATPIVAMQRAVGMVLAASDQPRHFSQEHRQVLKLTAAMATGCYDRWSLYEDRRRLMAIDPTTGLWAFEFFCSRLTEEISRCRRHKMPLSLMLIDPDGLVKYKETYGEEAADEVFRAMIQVVRGTVRGIDLVGRFGLNELLVATPQTDLQGATIAAERIRDAVEQTRFPRTGERITVSTGVSTLHSGGDDDVGLLLSRAQKGLYAARLQGSNCVVPENRLG